MCTFLFSYLSSLNDDNRTKDEYNVNVYSHTRMSLFFFNTLQAHRIQKKKLKKNEGDVFLYKDNNNSEENKKKKIT